MTTNLDFLKEGGLYPPRTEVHRLAKYNRYSYLFDGDVGRAYGSMIKDSTKSGVVSSSAQTLFSNPKITNFARAITKKTVDLMMSKTPALLSNTNARDLDLLIIPRETKIWRKVKTAFIDVSRFGNGYIRLYNKIPREQKMEKLTDGKVGINVLKPELVTYVVNPLDKEDVQKIVVGWIDEVEKTDSITIALQTPKSNSTEFYLTVEIHEVGFFEYRRFKVASPILSEGLVKQYVIQEEVTPAEMRGTKYPTGLEHLAVKGFINFTTSDNTQEGLSDYDMFDSLMIDLTQRLSSLSEVFDKHGNPAMQGPEELLAEDENGNLAFYTGDYYATEADNRLAYLTWDAKTADILKYANQILEQIFMLAEMGDGSIMGYTNGSTGFAESGKAIRMRMASPLMKVQSIISDNEPTIIETIYDCGVIMGKGIDINEIEIKWKDGLPSDWVEETNMFNSRIQSGTESVVYGLQRRYGMTPEQAYDEWKQILVEKNALQTDNSRGNINNDKSDSVEVETREQYENRVDGQDNL